MAENDSANSVNSNAEPPVAGDISGIKLDSHYKLIEKIGEGAASLVYKAEHRLLQKIVAIKILRKDLLTNPRAIERFKREARLSTRLDHPHIVKVTAFGISDDEQPFIVMDYHDCTTLEKTLGKERLALGTTLTIAAQILTALTYAHGLNIIHRDIKPANILLLQTADSASASVQLADFGLAKELLLDHNEKANLTQTAFMMGTPNYMSPEQCMAQAADQRSDIYSFGCVLYECLTGRKPFSAESDLAVMDKHLHEQVSFNPADKISADLQSIIFKCLNKNPQGRYQTASELAGDFQRISSARKKVSSPPRKTIAKYAIFIATVCLLLLCLLRYRQMQSISTSAANSSIVKSGSIAHSKHLGQLDIDPEELREDARRLRDLSSRKTDDGKVEELYRTAVKAYRTKGYEVGAVICLFEIGDYYFDRVGKPLKAKAPLVEAAKSAEALCANVPPPIEGQAPQDTVPRLYTAKSNLTLGQYAFMVDNNPGLAISTLEHALAFAPDDEYALKMKIRLEEANVGLNTNDLALPVKMIAANRRDANRASSIDSGVLKLDLLTDAMEIRVALKKQKNDEARVLCDKLLKKNGNQNPPYFFEYRDLYNDFLLSKRFDLASRFLDGLDSQVKPDLSNREGTLEAINSYRKQLPNSK